MKFVSFIKSQLWKLYFLVSTDAPLWVITNYYFLNTWHRITNYISGNQYERKAQIFRLQKSRLKLDNDWFTSNIRTWLRVFESEDIYSKSKLKCLEIGSWQGLSAYFTASELNGAELTCVDTWEGADEHQSGDEATEQVLSMVEQTFDHNLSEFSSRVNKFKGTSFSYFERNFTPDFFDLIYVDGSHHSDDVMVDAIKCFEMLKVGGLIIFDDYFWKYYPNNIDNPAGAINSFLRLKKHQLKIVAFDFQLVIKKTGRSYRYLYNNSD